MHSPLRRWRVLPSRSQPLHPHSLPHSPHPRQSAGLRPGVPESPRETACQSLCLPNLPVGLALGLEEGGLRSWGGFAQGCGWVVGEGAEYREQELQEGESMGVRGEHRRSVGGGGVRHSSDGEVASDRKIDCR